MKKNNNKKVKIFLTGGGTGGSVSPLLAISDGLTPQPPLPAGRGGDRSDVSYDFLWVGSRQGPERGMVEKAGIKFKPISGGKLRRYFSWRNFIDPVFIVAGFFQSFFIILKSRPSLVISAGSFISVPVVWAAWICRVPILIHQQDARAGLANKLMAPFAKVVTVTFKKSLKDYGGKAVWAGNPVRLSIVDCRLSIEELEKRFNTKKDLPVVLVIGGGTGAMAINRLVEQSLGDLVKICQIIHITGKNKKEPVSEARESSSFYQSFEFLETSRVAEAYGLADLVVSRCGMGVLTELSYLGKPSILIPIPNSHQEENAQIFKDQEAAVVLNQNELTPKKFISNLKRLLDDNVLRSKLRNNISGVIKRGANERMIKIIERIIHNS